MKLFARHIERNGVGQITVVPEDAEDMWHLYNLIQEGDSVRSTTYRKVTTESSTGSTSSQRVATTLTIAVEMVTFDTHAGTLHLKGRNIVENQHVKLGAYHTLDLDLNRKFTLKKPCWDVVHLERLDKACDPAQSADVAAIVMHEGLGHVCLITPNLTIVRAKIDTSIPRKRKGDTRQHDKGLERFFEQICQAVVRHVNFELVKCVLVASPGFVREQFMDYLMQWAAKNSHKVVTENKGKFVLVHSSSGFKHALNEVLADPSVAQRLADTKAQAEVKALEGFYELLANDPNKAFYGFDHVRKANERQAIETLMVSDELFRSKDLKERRQYVNLVQNVEDQNGNVLIFSSMHVSGERLGQLSGVAAILRFPMPEIEDEDESDDDEN